MLPVLISIGSFSISSFGFFLSLAFLYGTFLIWRLARAWDLDEEKILDLTLLTFFGGLIGSRIYFIIQHIDFFSWDIIKMIAITKYPGFSFWGAFLGGWLVLYFFVKRFKMDFWQVADIASIGFLGGMILGNIGCLLGGCGVGIESKLFFAVKMVGSIGNRIPVQAVETIFFGIILFYMWPIAKQFHIPGKIVGMVLVCIGIVKFILEFFRDNSRGGHFLSLTLILLGLVILHNVSRASWKDQLRGLVTDLGKIKDKFHLKKIK